MSYSISPAAEQDLDEIADYIAHDRPRAVAGVLDALEAGCRLVATHPTVGRQRNDIGVGVFSFPITWRCRVYGARDAGFSSSGSAFKQDGYAPMSCISQQVHKALLKCRIF